MLRRAVFLSVAFCALAPAGLFAESQRPWRAGWGVPKDIEASIAAAKEARFNVLISGGTHEWLRELTAKAKEEGIDVYLVFAPTVSRRNEEMAEFGQVMTPEDDEALEEIRARTDPGRGGYQLGGEPLPGRHEALLTNILCHHRPEVIEWSKRQVAETMEAVPDAKGVALDFFGYRNYRHCVCPASQDLFQAFREEHPDLGEQEALETFSRDTLVEAINEIAGFVRETRAGAKVAIHIYPTFLPEPLYGNRLDVDYACQTVAWFFEPFWDLDKVRRYTRAVVEEADRHYPRQRGVPFVGVYVNRPFGHKPAERLAKELEAIHEAAGGADLCVCDFSELVKHEELLEAVKRAYPNEAP